MLFITNKEQKVDKIPTYEAGGEGLRGESRENEEYESHDELCTFLVCSRCELMCSDELGVE